jgi:hypothetical protein
LQQVHGSKATKKKSGSKIKTLAKNCLIALAVNSVANEAVNAGKPQFWGFDDVQVSDSNIIPCKYNVSHQERGMMNFVTCAKNRDFKKYMFENSENCSKVKELYGKTKRDGNCAFETPEIIYNGALAKFSGKQLSHATNVEMMKEYLSTYYEKDDALSTSGESVSDFFRGRIPEEDFDFFRFTRMLELTKLVFPDDEHIALEVALDAEHKHVNTNLFRGTKIIYPSEEWSEMQIKVKKLIKELKDANPDAKKLLELTKLVFPKDAQRALSMALDRKYKDINPEHAKELLELTKLAYPNDAHIAVTMALDGEYKDISPENAKKVLEFTKLAYPNETFSAVVMALDSDYKDINPEHVNKLLELTKLAFPHDTYSAVAMALDSKFKKINPENAKKLLELTELIFPQRSKAVTLAMDTEYNKKYEDLKNSWSWYLSSEEDIMIGALKATHPEFGILKTDF